MKLKLGIFLAASLAASGLASAQGLADSAKPVSATRMAKTGGMTKAVLMNDVSGSPLTVFVDGPTGFVFVYTTEGWKFVGDSQPARK